ncbi:MAG: right-handed parallel beta-helix repeat-containing protein [Candidatus Eisenbacteria bacterium]
MKSIVFGVLLLVAAFHPAVSSADTVFVDYDGQDPNFSRIQDGIDAVSDGGTVMVGATISLGVPVTFRGLGNRGLDFGGKNITLWSLTGPDMIAIDCEGADRAILLSTGTDSTSHITGFTFLNGHATDGGGAIKCEGGSPRISDCMFRDNSTSADGGAIILTHGPTRITDCAFYGNHASGVGGAIHATDSDITITACTFSDNEAADGGAISLVDTDLTMSLCTLANNEGATGAGVRFQTTRPGRSAVIEQCVLAFGRLGRAVAGGTPEIFHCCVFGNANGDDLPGNVHDNEFVDPRVCDLYGIDGGNMSLCSNSPCLQSNNIWGLQVGSKAQGCPDCNSPIQHSGWSSIKALFR